MAFPGTFNISYYEGDTYEFKIYPKNSIGGVFDLTVDYSVKFTIADGRGATVIVNGTPQPVTQYECHASIGIDSAVTCLIPPGIGRQLVAGTAYVYDVQVRKPSGATEIIHTLLTGNISVTADVTGAI
jgi:hypothetical protein